MNKTPSIVTSEAGWRQVRAKVVNNQQIFKVEEVRAWAVQDDGAALPLSVDDYRLVEIVSPLCEDTEEELLQRARSRTLH
jgi:hypothetical protein